MNRDEILKGIEKMQVFKETSDKLSRAGLIIPEKPADAVQGINLFTEWEKMKQRYGGIANIPFSELGDFLDRWTALISYTRWVEAVSDIEQSSALEIRDTVKKQLYTLQTGSREIRDAMVSIEPTYIKLEQDYNEKVSLYKAIKGLREGYETRANAISREITRRGADVSDLRRGYNRGSGV
jgi:hypothetical protein